MASKLKTLSTSYQSFQEDQVLTHEQLNRFLAYFDDQDRLSRVMLDGVGLSCGFNVKHDVIDGNHAIRISKGAGVTTDGDILTLLNKNGEGELSVRHVDKIYPYYREFIDEKANYDHFIQGGSPLAPMYELISSADYDPTLGDLEISDLTGYQNRVIVLYVEAYQNEGELCDGLSCDNQGIEQVSRLRVLILTKTQADQIISKDPLYRKNDRREVYHQLKDLAVKRVVLDADEYTAPLDLALKFAVGNESQLISELKTSLDIIGNKLQGYIPSNLISSIKNKIVSKIQASGGISSGYFQYRHDFLLEVVDTYNRVKDLFLLFSSECVPPLESFPKHLMLGVVSPSVEDEKFLRYRHQFYKSSLLEEFGEEFSDFMFLLNRMDTMLDNYLDLPGSSSLNRDPIRITPSFLDGETGQGAVPFYYEASTNLLKAWNAQKTFEGKFKRNLSYHISELVQLPQFTAPLDYNFRKNDLFRIEGHQGKNYIEAFEAIEGLKKSKGLAFDVKVLALNENAESTINYDDYACHFEDLELLLEAWSKEQQCTLAKATSLLSGFSLVEPGENSADDALTAPIGTVTLYTDWAATIGSVGTIATAENIGSAAKSMTVDTTDRNTSAFRSAATTGTTGTIGTTGTTGVGGVGGAGENLSQVEMIYDAGGPLFYTSTPVEDSLSNDVNTVGEAFTYALGNAGDATPASWISTAGYFTDNVLTDLPDLWNPNEFDILINNSFTLLAYAQALSGSVPQTLSGINSTIVTNYQTKISNLCTAVSQAQLAYTNNTDLTDDSISAKNKTILGLAVNQLNTICCAAEKIKALFDEIKERKDEILSKSVLTQFKKTHPSLEHIAGVQPGGTFVMVYNNLGGSKQVIADFALPYMCCSDCAPVNYVLNQPAASLQLSGGSPICLDGEEIVNRTFIVQPADAVITSVPDASTIPGFTIEGNQLTVDPSTFTAANYGQTINFLVNDQPTDTSIQVSKKLIVDFDAPTGTVYTQSFDFTNTGADAGSVATYDWDFGDGGSSSAASPSHTYNFATGSQNVVTVRMVATHANGLCTTVVEHTFTIVVREIDIVDGYEYCKTDGAPHAIKILPDGHTGTIGGFGVEGGVFKAANVPVGTPSPITITLDGEPMTTITLCDPPELAVTHQSSVGRLQLNVTMGYADNGTWVLSNQGGTVVYQTINNASNQELANVSLLGSAYENGLVFATYSVEDDCCGNTATTIEIAAPPVVVVVDPEIDLFPKQYCPIDNGSYSFIMSSSADPSKITWAGGSGGSFVPSSVSSIPADRMISIFYDGKLAFKVEICDPVPFPRSINTTKSNITLDASNLDIKDSEVYFESAKETKIGNTRKDVTHKYAINITKPMQETLAEGRLYLVLKLDTDCCKGVIKKYEVTIPVEAGGGELPVVKLPCETDVQNKLPTQHTDLIGFVNGINDESFSKEQTGILEEVMLFFNKSTHSAINLASGSANGTLVTAYSSWLPTLYTIITKGIFQKESDRALFVTLYGRLTSVFMLIIQCQSQNLIIETKLDTVMTRFTTRLARSGKNSFAGVQVDIDPSGVILNQVTSSETFQSAGSTKANYLQNLIAQLT